MQELSSCSRTFLRTGTLGSRPRLPGSRDEVVLTVEQYYLILVLIPQPYRMMVMMAQCTGLRAEEVLALE
jgi:integrase